MMCPKSHSGGVTFEPRQADSTVPALTSQMALVVKGVSVFRIREVSTYGLLSPVDPAFPTTLPALISSALMGPSTWLSRQER